MTWDRDYYQKNKEEINAKRRERYKTNKAVREAAREASARTKEHEKERLDGRVPRTYQGKEVLCHRIGDVADKIGRTSFIIRWWEREGVIPPPIFEGEQRVYTEHQVHLLNQLSQAIRNAEPSKKDTAHVKKYMSPKIHEQWRGGL